MSTDADPLPGTAAGTARLGSASALLASGTIVSRILGFIKVAVLAAAIGQVGSASADTFAIANQLPNNVYALVAGGVLSAVLVPQIVRASSGADGGRQYINRIVTLGVVIFAVVTLIATLLAPALIDLYSQSAVAASDGTGRGFSPEAFALATAFAYLCLPQIFFYALYNLMSEVFNARNVFGPFAWAPVVNNIVAIAGLVVFMALFGGAQQNSAVDVWSSGRILLLAGTATLGVAAQAVVLFLFWRRSGLSYRPDFRWRGVGLGATGRAAGWLFGMVVVTQITGVVQSRVASMASGDAASISALQNSWLIFMLPHSVVAVSIATAYFTRMSGHAARSDLAAMRTDLSGSLRGIGLLIVFASVALAVVAYPFARFFESDYPNVVAMGNVILALLPGLVLFSALFVMQRAFYALGDTRTPFILQCVQSVVFVVGAIACIALPTQWIAVGIAVSTTVSSSTQAVIAILLVRRRLGGGGGGLILVRYLQYLGLSLVAGGIGFGVLLLLGGLDASGFAQSGRVQAIVAIAIVGVVMAIVYGGLLAAIRNPELVGVTRSIARRLGRRKAE
ncbi:murein biosynthesis integral membrane protein MurJ [Leifsonia bigeumensis]|uniref:Murein biosynthesis integral membrane protein MurJ n=1 Tax=Leifsonella bigeumensis TaxID=433643 RepID=A0ABP7F4N2_9MICO